MSKIEIGIIAIIVFVLTGVGAYAIESILFRHWGTIGRFESLYEYFKKIDQKQGNITAAVWAAIWVVLIALSALLIYLLS